MLETELIDHILKAAKDISSLHIIPAQVALKQAEFKLNKWKDLHPVTANQQPGMFFGMHKSNRFICSWLGELHQHLLAKFCLFFYSAFKDQKKHNSGKLILSIINRSPRDVNILGPPLSWSLGTLCRPRCLKSRPFLWRLEHIPIIRKNVI